MRTLQPTQNLRDARRELAQRRRRISSQPLHEAWGEALYGLEDEAFEVVAFGQRFERVSTVGDVGDGEADVGVVGAGVTAGDDQAGVLEAVDEDVGDETL